MVYLGSLLLYTLERNEESSWKGRGGMGGMGAATLSGFLLGNWAVLTPRTFHHSQPGKKMKIRIKRIYIQVKYQIRDHLPETIPGQCSVSDPHCRVIKRYIFDP